MDGKDTSPQKDVNMYNIVDLVGITGTGMEIFVWSGKNMNEERT